METGKGFLKEMPFELREGEEHAEKYSQETLGKLQIQLCAALRGYILRHVVRPFCHCTNIIEYTDTNLDSIAYFAPRSF